MSGQSKKDNVRRKLNCIKSRFIAETERSISKDGPYNALDLVNSGQVLETGTVRQGL